MMTRHLLQSWFLGVVAAAGVAALGTPAGCGMDSQGLGLTTNTCTDGSMTCNGQCVAVDHDPQNCGACGADCGEGSCSGGVCHCGEAGACGSGAACMAGVCHCTAGFTQCGDACVALGSDALNCGACGISCGAAGACTAGQCACNQGALYCGGRIGCADVTTDVQNCGACGHACAPSATCVAGQCQCATGQTACGAACADFTSDAQNCGACGNVCSGVCVDGLCQMLGCATIGRQNCGGACLTASDLDHDPLNCGACGNACATSQVCAGGSCLGAFTPPACAACPCAECGVGTTCCKQAGASSPVCVQGSVCPP